MFPETLFHAPFVISLFSFFLSFHHPKAHDNHSQSRKPPKHVCHSCRPSINKDALVNELEDREAVKGVEHEIELEFGTKPICIPVRRFSPKEMEALTKQVKELQQQPIVCKCFVGAQEERLDDH